MFLSYEMLLQVSAVVLMFILVDRTLNKWIKMEEAKKERDAKDLLEAHGYSAHLYLPTIGQRDTNLAEAMTRVSGNGYVILDREGKLAGKVVPNLKKEKHTSLRLVVDNTN